MAWNRLHYPDHCLVAKSATIHETAIIGRPGMSVKGADGPLVNFKHTGKVVIHDDVEVGPLSIIQRASSPWFR